MFGWRVGRGLARRRVRRRPRARRGRRSGNRRIVTNPSLEVPAVQTPGLLGRLRSIHVPGVLVGLALLAGGAIGATAFVTRSSYFRVRSYTFGPLTHVTADQLRRFAHLKPGGNIFAVDLEDVARRVAAHPWVAAARARRRLPGRIHIEVTERQAAAAVLMGRFYLTDPHGTVFKRARPSEMADLVVITGITREEFDRERIRAVRRLQQALEVLRLYKSRPYRPPLAEIHISDSGEATLYTRRHGMQIRLGRGGWLAKLKRLDVLLTALGKDAARLRVVHLDNDVRPDRITVRMAGSSG